jgi:ribosomal protein L35
MRSHNLETKSAKKKRGFRKEQLLTRADTNKVKKMLGMR